MRTTSILMSNAGWQINYFQFHLHMNPAKKLNPNLFYFQIPAADLNGLLANKEALTAVLLRHVVPAAALQGKDVPPGATPLDTAGGEKITVNRGQFIQVSNPQWFCSVAQLHFD